MAVSAVTQYKYWKSQGKVREFHVVCKVVTLLSVCLCVCLFVCPSLCLSVYVCLPVCLSVSVSVCLCPGVRTGRCVRSVVNASLMSCEIIAWCPVELDKLPVYVSVTFIYIYSHTQQY